VQWLDPPSEEAVGFAVRRLEHEAVGLLCAQRTSHPGDGLPLELDRALLRADLLPVGGLSLGARGVRVIPVPADEYETMACNVLAIAPAWSSWWTVTR